MAGSHDAMLSILCNCSPAVHRGSRQKIHTLSHTHTKCMACAAQVRSGCRHGRCAVVAMDGQADSRDGGGGGLTERQALETGAVRGVGHGTWLVARGSWGAARCGGSAATRLHRRLHALRRGPHPRPPPAWPRPGAAQPHTPRPGCLVVAMAMDTALAMAVLRAMLMPSILLRAMLMLSILLRAMLLPRRIPGRRRRARAGSRPRPTRHSARRPSPGSHHHRHPESMESMLDATLQTARRALPREAPHPRVLRWRPRRRTRRCMHPPAPARVCSSERTPACRRHLAHLPLRSRRHRDASPRAPPRRILGLRRPPARRAQPGQAPAGVRGHPGRAPRRAARPDGSPPRCTPP